MRRSRFSVPQINSGSLADIAFLLLIFFLVTATIPNDQGFNRKLPKPCPPGEKCDAIIQERNLLQIILNEKNEIMAEDDIISLTELRSVVKKFIDNNGDGSCEYCHGEESDESSDNPSKAIISLVSHPNSTYSSFVAIQDELTKAYFELRLDYANSILQKAEYQLTEEDIKLLKEVYPFIISEAQTK